MALYLLVLLIAVPLLELAVIIQVGSVIGIVPTILLVIAISVFGTFLLRRQGLTALAKAQEALAAGRMPLESIGDGASLAIAAALLMTPGLITDAIGFLLLVPPVRRWLGRWAMRRLLRAPGLDVRMARSEARRPAPGGRRGSVIEGEFERLDEPAPKRPGGGERLP